MLKKFFIPRSPLDKYFKEADGDETDQVSITTAPRKNRGTDYDAGDAVTVSPRTNRGMNYGADDAEADAETDAPADEGPDTDEAEDYGAEDAPEDTATDEPAEEDGAGDEGVDGDAEGPYTGEEDGGETDYSGDNTGGEEDTAAADDGEDTGEELTPEEREEAMKKYHMYKRFVHLYNVIQSFIERCQNVVKPDPIQNTVIKTVMNNLNDIYDNMFDYMTIKYKTATYVQVLIYFETVISAVRLNFELLRNNKINLKQ